MTFVDPASAPSTLLPEGVGRTPLVEIEGIFAKLECVNPLGSIKDRVAAFILESAKQSGALSPGQTIVEATSGNTGIAFAYYGRRAGHRVVVVMPENMTAERKRLIRRLGASLILCSKKGSFAEAARMRDQLARECGAFNPDQFGNPLNTECHRLTTGMEIVSQHFGVPPNPAFVAGVGTGGTLLGVGAALRQAWGRVALIAVEPAEAAVMSGGSVEPHGIAGIGDGFIPELAGNGQGGVHPMIDAIKVVTTEEAKLGAAELHEKHGLCVGVSSGANFVVARRLKREYSTVFTVFPDGHQKYRSAGLHGPSAQCPFASTCARSKLECLLRE